MTYFYCFVKDCSGAAIKDKRFQDNSRKLLEQFKCEVKIIEKEVIAEDPEAKSEIRFFSWEGWCATTTEEQLDSFSKRTSGVAKGGPDELIDYLHHNLKLNNQNNKIKLLYVVTNSGDSSAMCSVIKDQIKCETFAFYTFYQGLELVDEDTGDEDKVAIDYFPDRDNLKSQAHDELSKWLMNL